MGGQDWFHLTLPGHIQAGTQGVKVLCLLAHTLMIFQDPKGLDNPTALALPFIMHNCLIDSAWLNSTFASAFGRWPMILASPEGVSIAMEAERSPMASPGLSSGSQIFIHETYLCFLLLPFSLEGFFLQLRLHLQQWPFFEGL